MSIDPDFSHGNIGRMAKLIYSVHIEPMPKGGFYVTVPAIPECRTTAKSFDASITKVTRVIEKHVAAMAKAGKRIPTEDQKMRPLCLPIRVTLPKGAKTILASKLMLAA